MLQVMELKKIGMDSKGITEKTKLAPFVVTKTLKQIANFTYMQVKEALNEGVELETMIKQGNITDKVAVEMLLIKYSN